MKRPRRCRGLILTSASCLAVRTALIGAALRPRRALTLLGLGCALSGLGALVALPARRPIGHATLFARGARARRALTARTGELALLVAILLGGAGFATLACGVPLLLVVHAAEAAVAGSALTPL